MTLCAKLPQHCKFPYIFIRRIKAIYISVVDKEILRFAQEIDKLPPSYDGLKKAICSEVMAKHNKVKAYCC